ncbi:MAG: hypothetical protein WBZ20_10720 [Nitrososphaeraceae archaeon]
MSDIDKDKTNQQRIFFTINNPVIDFYYGGLKKDVRRIGLSVLLIHSKSVFPASLGRR